MAQWLPEGIPDPDVDSSGDPSLLLQLIFAALGSITSSIYFPGSVSNPYEAKTDEPFTLFTDGNYDGIIFTIGPQWTSYLTDPTTTVWLTLANEKRPRVKVVDAQGTITSTTSGIVSVPLTPTQLDIHPGKYLWQIQLRTLDGETVERRVAMEGMAYVKKMFRVP